LGGNAGDRECERALQFFLSHYNEHKLDNTCAYPGVAEALEHLSAYPMAVLTNKPVRVSVRILEGLGLAKYFRAVYGGNSFETKKPDPLGANTILREFAASPNEAILIGDSEVDIQTARNAGTLAAAVNYGFGTHDRAVYPADVYLDRLLDLALSSGSVANEQTLVAFVVLRYRAALGRLSACSSDSSLNWMRRAACSARAAIWRR